MYIQTFVGTLKPAVSDCDCVFYFCHNMPCVISVRNGYVQYSRSGREYGLVLDSKVNPTDWVRSEASSVHPPNDAYCIFLSISEKCINFHSIFVLFRFLASTHFDDIFVLFKKRWTDRNTLTCGR